MNNRGQILVLFIIFIPIFLTIATFVIDIGNNYGQANKLNSINKMVIKYGLKNIDHADLKKEMLDLLYKNDSDIDKYELIINEEKISLNITKSIDSIFGNIVGIKFYEIKSNYYGYIDNSGKLIIEKG